MLAGLNRVSQVEVRLGNSIRCMVEKKEDDNDVSSPSTRVPYPRVNALYQ